MQKNAIETDFSILIPAYGPCPYLSETLESICKSSLMPKEVILVDDGIDRSIFGDLKSFHPRLNLTVLPNNGQGLVSALNTGLQHSKTEYVARLDSDDLAHPDRFKLQLERMAANPKISVLGGQASYIDLTSTVIGRSNYVTGRLDDTEDFKKHCMVAHPAAMIRLSDALAVGGYRSICRAGRIDLAEDFDLWLRISRIGQVHNLSEKIIFYRQHGGQISTLYTPGQIFATNYVSLVCQAEIANPNFHVEKLNIESFKTDFLVRSIKSLAPFVSLRELILLTMEGSLIYFNLSDGVVSRIIRKLIRVSR
jgi:glycosyltransferase involved in cell wall biosynthesis